MKHPRKKTSVNSLPPTELSVRCRNKRADNAHEPFCFELFRRAIVEDCVPCWADIFEIYRNLIRFWIVRRAQTGNNIAGYTVDELTQRAFTCFWRAYTPDKLARAKGLGHILNYLKSCSLTAVAIAYRQSEKNSLKDEAEKGDILNDARRNRALESDILQKIAAEELWAAVEAICKNERELLIARLALKAALKPRRVAEIHPELFSGIADVYRIKRNLMNRLKRSLNLKIMYEKWPE